MHPWCRLVLLASSAFAIAPYFACATPAAIIYGVSTSAFQYEGAWNADGKGASIWDEWGHAGRITAGDTGDFADDTYHRLAQHVDLVAGLGVGAYRFSLSWPRLVPLGDPGANATHSSSTVNPAGVRFYTTLLDLLDARGIEPYVTIYHWDLPQALQASLGGWLSPALPAVFERYAALCFRLFGHRVSRWMTVNEPWSVALGAYYQGTFAPGPANGTNATAWAPYLAGHHLLLAHARAVQAYRALDGSATGGGGGEIGIVLNTNWYAPANAGDPTHRAAATRALTFQFGWFMDPITTGTYPAAMRARVGARLPTFTAAEAALLRGSFDWIGLNHYTTSVVEPLPSGMHLPYPPGYAFDQAVLPLPTADWPTPPPGGVAANGWPVVPEGLRNTLAFVTHNYSAPPIVVTENGYAGANDTARIAYLADYIAAAKTAQAKDGADLRGYFVWSVADNLEWSSGYGTRFGLVSVKRAKVAHDGNTTRPVAFTPKPSYEWYKKLVNKEAQQHTPAAPPNVVLIVADDLGFSDISLFGSEIQTPAIDSLLGGRGSAAFTSFYTNAICSPSRASLLTGVEHHKAGMGLMADSYWSIPTNPQYQGFLGNNTVTIAELLQSAGFQTFMSGKWHVGGQRPHWPIDRGFNRSWGLIPGCGSYWRPKGLFEDGDAVPPPPANGSFYLTDEITRHALAYLDEMTPGGRPFFLYVAYTAAHWPLHAPAADIARHTGRWMAGGWDAARAGRFARQRARGVVPNASALAPRDAAVAAWPPPGGGKEAAALWDLRQAVFAAQVDRMDDGVRQILAKLAALGKATEDNTMVLWLSDNGGTSSLQTMYNFEMPNALMVQPFDPVGLAPGPQHSFDSYRLPWGGVSNTPFRKYKTWSYEGGLATPMIARFPNAGGSGGGRFAPDVVSIMDVLATIADAADVPWPSHHPRTGVPVLPLDGKSFLPVLRGGRGDANRTLHWEQAGNRAIRKGKYKAVSGILEPSVRSFVNITTHRIDCGGAHGYVQADWWELYDLGADRTEQHNLNESLPDMVAELRGEWEAWAADVGVLPWEVIRGHICNGTRRRE